MKTLFEKIIAGELEGEIVYEDEQIVAIKDKYPKAPVHLLLIPRKPIPSIQELATDEDFALVGAIFRVAQKLVALYGLESGYRIVVNNGPQSGQEIFHVHFHLMGGRQLGSMG